MVTVLGVSTAGCNRSPESDSRHGKSEQGIVSNQDSVSTDEAEGSREEDGKLDSAERLLLDLDVVAQIEGNFTADEGTERLSFLYDADQHHDPNLPEGIHEVVLTLANESANGRAVALGLRTLGYREKELDVLAGFAEQTQSPHKRFIVTDLNANGMDELYFLRISGMGSWVGVWEWEDGVMVDQIADGGTIEVVTGLELVGEIGDCPCGFRVYGLGRMGDPANVRDWVEYAWDSDARDYVVVDSGLDEWEGNWFSDE